MKHLPTIKIKSIPHRKQRYETCGDYYHRWGKWQFRISKINSKYEFLILIHELVEWFLTQQRGITEEQISNFDILFEAKRSKGSFDEPGHDKKAPYHKEHVFAEKIEKQLAKELKVDWKKYDKTINKL